MKKKKKSNKKGKSLVLVGVLTLGGLLYLNISNRNYELKVKVVSEDTTINDPKPTSGKTMTDTIALNMYFNENKDLITLASRTFRINEDTLIKHLKDNYKEINLLDQKNPDKFLFEYLLKLETKNKKLFNNKILKCSDNKEYIVSLIRYFTKIYPEVDFTIAASIASIESGYQAVGMLNVNNIFGGMSGTGLLKYKTIEYGVLKYILLLKDGYFNKGLKTIESIGRVYNPIENENGVKVANPIWVSGVSAATKEFKNKKSVDATYVNSLKKVVK